MSSTGPYCKGIESFSSSHPVITVASCSGCGIPASRSLLSLDDQSVLLLLSTDWLEHGSGGLCQALRGAASLGNWVCQELGQGRTSPSALCLLWWHLPAHEGRWWSCAGTVSILQTGRDRVSPWLLCPWMWDRACLLA